MTAAPPLRLRLIIGASLVLLPALALALRQRSAVAPAGGSAPYDEAGSLAGCLPDPALFIEVPDVDRLDRALAEAGFGKLWERIEAFVESSAALQEAFGGEEILADLESDGGRIGLAHALRGAVQEAAVEMGADEEAAAALATSLGARLSIALDLAGEGSECPLAIAFAWSLEPGASKAVCQAIEEQIAPSLADADVAIEPLELARGEDGVRAVWKLKAAEDGEHFAVLRPDLIAWTSSRALAKRIAGERAAGEGAAEARTQVGEDFRAARQASLAAGELAWGRIGGACLERAIAEGQAEEAAVTALGLDGLRSVAFGLSKPDQRLATRIRLEHSGAGGLLSILRGGQARYASLETLTSDCFAVFGVPRGLAELSAECAAIAADVDDFELSAALENPVLQKVLQSGVLGSEVVAFLRPGKAGVPMMYTAVPAGPALAVQLSSLEGGPELASHGARLRVKTLQGQRFFELTPIERGAFRRVALLPLEGFALISDSTFALEAWSQERARERLSDRQAVIASVREAIAAAGAASPLGPGSAAGFAHVRSRPLFEWAWPFVLLGLQFAGVEDLEALPDAAELAEIAGDTTWVAHAQDGVIELRGRGLLGGLLLVL